MAPKKKKEEEDIEVKAIEAIEHLTLQPFKSKPKGFDYVSYYFLIRIEFPTFYRLHPYGHVEYGLQIVRQTFDHAKRIWRNLAVQDRKSRCQRRLS